MIFIEPEATFAARHAYGPTATCAPLRGVQHLLAPKVMAAMRQNGREPIQLWRFINALARAEQPEYRLQHRFWRVRFLTAIRELRRVQLIFQHYDLIALADFPYKSRRKTPKRQEQSVRKAASQTGGSNAATAPAETVPKIPQPPASHLSTVSQTAMAPPPLTKNATPSADEISAAASELAQRTRPRIRKWTGVLRGERLRRRSLVQVPSGEVLPAYIVTRGKVIVLRFPCEDAKFLARFDESEVIRIKNPAAVTLGRLKRGVRERPSATKAAAARANGCMPPRPGSRPRGRPRTAPATAEPPVAIP